MSLNNILVKNLRKNFNIKNPLFFSNSKSSKGSWFSKKRSVKIQPGLYNQKRAQLIVGCFFLGFLLLISRAIIIHLFPPAAKNLATIADKQYSQAIKLAPYRGTIYDRRMDPLAISIRLPSLFVNPRTFNPTRQEVKLLAKSLRIKPRKIRKLKNKKGYFAWLKRKVSHQTSDTVKSLGIRGLYSVDEPSRFYPAGQAAAPLLGMVGTDNFGLMGLERQFDKELRGDRIKLNLLKDAKDQSIFLQPNDAAPETPGHNIHLSIDRVIQEITELALYEGIKNAKAQGGFAIVSDPHTGRILALANQPTFNPNKPKSLDMKKTKNRALMDVYEPGSIVKPFIFSKAIELKITKRHALHNCEKGYLKIGRQAIRDSHPKEILSTEGVIIHSSNVCSYKIADKMGMNLVYDTLSGFGFGLSESFLGFPGETSGRISNPKYWRKMRFANISFGYGFTVTGLEIIQALSAIANGGNLIKPSLVERITTSEGHILQSNPAQIKRRILKPETAKTLRSILAKVVEKGTATKAKTAFFSVGGKTGTTEKLDPKTKAYSKEKHRASFMGFAPVKDPHIVAYVVIDEPGEKPYFGGVWAAPIFSKIATGVLRYLNVKPDLEGEKVSLNQEMVH